MRRHTVKHRAKPRWRMPSMLTLHAGALKAKLPLRGSGTIALAGQFPDSGTHFTFGRVAVAEPPHTIRIDRLPLAGAQLPADLLDAFARQETHNPQLGLDWLRNLAQHALDPGDEAVLYTATAPTGERVCLPMREGRDRSAHALANFYTSLYAPLETTTNTAALYTALFRHLASQRRRVALTLSPLAADTPHFQTLTRALYAAGWRGLHGYSCFGNWYHPLDGADWETYLASLSSRVRNTVTRRTRRFLRDGRGELAVLCAGDELEDAISAFTAIYNNSWKRPEPYPRFMPELLRLAARRGWLRLGIARYDGRPVAAQAWLVSGGVAHIFKLAYHGDFAELSPGTVLSAHLMEYVISRDGVEAIDYGSGDDAYKKDWMSRRRERRGIAAYNPRTASGAAQWLARSLRNALLRRGADQADSGAAP